MTDMNDAPPKPKRTWIWIVVGVLAFLLVLGVGAAVFTAVWVSNHMEIVDAPAADATKSFDEIRAKFPGQQPLLEFQGDEPRVIASHAAASSVRLSLLHIIAFDDDEGKLVRVDVPFWLLRLKSGPISFSSYTSGFDDRRVNLSVEDIERRGPGIVLDITEPREGRVLIWAE